MCSSSSFESSVSFSSVSFGIIHSTRFAYELLKHANVMFTEDPDKIPYCYGIYQDLYREMEQSIPGITFLEGLPSKSEIEDFTRDRRSHPSSYEMFIQRL
jgi:hypothetical protein